MANTNSILSEDAAALPLTLRRIARAFLDRDHLFTAASLPTHVAGQAVADARYAAVLACLGAGFSTLDGAPVPGTATVRDSTGRTRLYLHYRYADQPWVEAFSSDGEPLGVAHMAVQFPLLADEG